MRKTAGLCQPVSVSSLRRLSLLSDLTGEAGARTPSPMSAGVRLKPSECVPKSPIPRPKVWRTPSPLEGNRLCSLYIPILLGEGQERQGAGLGREPGVRLPAQEAGLRQVPLFHAAAHWLLLPPPAWRGSCSYLQPRLRPGPTQVSVGPCLQPSTAWKSRWRAGGRTAGNGCVGCALQNSRRCHLHHSRRTQVTRNT